MLSRRHLPFQSRHHGLHIMGNGSDIELYQRVRKFASLYLCICSSHFTIRIGIHLLWSIHTSLYPFHQIILHEKVSVAKMSNKFLVRCETQIFARSNAKISPLSPVGVTWLRTLGVGRAESTIGIRNFNLLRIDITKMGKILLNQSWMYNVVRDSSVGIVTGSGLDGLGIESRWGRDFSHTSRPALGPTQPPV
jgi:hypothetical protein